MKKKAIIYCRISSNLQVKNNNTLSQQENICRGQAKKLKADIVRVFSEIGQGDDPSRSELIQLEAYISTNTNIDFIIVSESKRFARSVEIGQKFIEIMRTNKIELIDCKNPTLRGEDSYASFLEQLAKGKREKLHIGKNTKEAMNSKISKGAPLGRPTTGLKLVKKNAKLTLEIAPNNDIKTMFQFAKQGLTIKEIQQKLESQTSKKVADSTLRHRLRNKRYAGFVKDNKGVWKKGYIKPIISEQLFNDVQKLLGNKQKREKRRKSTANNNLLPLRNLLICGKCGKRFTGSRIYYRCNNCSINLKNDELHKELVKFLNSFDIVNLHRAGFVAGYYSIELLMLIELNTMSNEAQDKLSIISESIKSLELNFLKYPKKITEAVYDEELSILKQSKANITKRLNQIPHLGLILIETLVNPPTIKDLGDKWDNASTNEKKNILKAMFPNGISYETTFKYTKLNPAYKVKQGKSNISELNRELKQVINIELPKLKNESNHEIVRELCCEAELRIETKNLIKFY